MRVLLVTQWFDPEPTPKGLLFARALAAKGHDVTVVTGFPNYPGGKLYDGYRLAPVSVEEKDGIRVFRVLLYPSHDGNGLHRLLNYLTFACSATVACLVVGRPDVAYFYHPPGSIGLAAISLKRFRGVPYIYDIQDLWPDTLAATGMVTSRALLGIIDAFMREVYREAALVTVLSPGFARKLSGRGVPVDKTRVIYNWTPEEYWALECPGAGESPLGERSEHSFRVLFAGNMGKAQELEVALDAAALCLQSRHHATFHFMGGGIERDRLEQLAHGRSLTNVHFHHARRPSQMPEALASADALLVHLRADPLFSITIPSKTQSALHAGRPVLMGVEGDACDLVTEAGAGLPFKPGDAASMADAVMRLAALDPAERERMGKSGRDFYFRRMSSVVGVRGFDEALREAASSHGSRGGLSWIATCFMLALAVTVIPRAWRGSRSRMRGETRLRGPLGT